MKPYQVIQLGRTQAREVTIGALIGSAAAVALLVWLASFL